MSPVLISKNLRKHRTFPKNLKKGVGKTGNQIIDWGHLFNIAETGQNSKTPEDRNWTKTSLK